MPWVFKQQKLKLSDSTNDRVQVCLGPGHRKAGNSRIWDLRGTQSPSLLVSYLCFSLPRWLHSSLQTSFPSAADRPEVSCPPAATKRQTGFGLKTPRMGSDHSGMDARNWLLLLSGRIGARDKAHSRGRGRSAPPGSQAVWCVTCNVHLCRCLLSTYCVPLKAGFGSIPFGLLTSHSVLSRRAVACGVTGPGEQGWHADLSREVQREHCEESQGPSHSPQHEHALCPERQKYNPDSEHWGLGHWLWVDVLHCLGFACLLGWSGSPGWP
jgi:hypothetical protein